WLRVTAQAAAAREAAQNPQNPGASA
ncbi:methylenetetrahydrofolate reductase, partial [Mesorhizobium sp. M1A.F.Ca.IN.022.04.1.1]